MEYIAKGKLQIDRGLRINVDIDFIRYYKHLIEKSLWDTEKLQLPMYGSHITLINPKIHTGFSYSAAVPYVGKDIEFEYDPTLIHASKVNYWLPITCPFGEYLKKQCGAFERGNYLGLHLTICNRKFKN